MNFIFTSDQKAIVHIDGDAFFASCEQAVNPAYKGKPVITGLERKIVSCASYEAKKFGIKRGVPLWEVKKKCPDVIILPSHYETYSLFSKRMYDIIRRFTSEVEEYSIDEAFADITGLRRSLHKSYSEIALAIKKNIQEELGITVSIGLSYTKVLAKIASKWHKPDNFTVISLDNWENFLKSTELTEIWGIGNQTSYFLNKYKIKNAWEYASLKEDWINEYMSNPYKEIWWELNGKSVLPVIAGEKDKYKSIGKTKTFAPPSSDYNYIFAQLSKNIENAFIKARRYNLAARKIVFYLKTNNFRYCGLEAKLNRACSFPNEVMPMAREIFNKIFIKKILYRATGVVLVDLQSRNSLQLNLFESVLKIEKLEKIYAAVDSLDGKYGKHTVFLGSSLAIMRSNKPRQFINLPFLGQTV
jgi:DNA polymerase-4/DNA polymerase V